MIIKYPEVGICGLSCRLCPNYHTEAKSRCAGCKSQERMSVGCPFITCAIKKKGIEFCWECQENKSYEKWKKHRELGRKYDSFKSYQKLEDNIAYIQNHGVIEFDRVQRLREKILGEMLQEFNEGRSKSYYCIAVEVLEIEELEEAIAKAKEESKEMDIKGKPRILHALLDEIVAEKNYTLKLRKQKKAKKS